MTEGSWNKNRKIKLENRKRRGERVYDWKIERRKEKGNENQKTNKSKIKPKK